MLEARKVKFVISFLTVWYLGGVATETIVPLAVSATQWAGPRSSSRRAGLRPGRIFTGGTSQADFVEKLIVDGGLRDLRLGQRVGRRGSCRRLFPQTCRTEPQPNQVGIFTLYEPDDLHLRPTLGALKRVNLINCLSEG